MEHGARIDAAERELGALHQAVIGGDPTVPVPTCPGWTVADLAAHVGELLGFWCHVLCEASGRPKPDAGPPPATRSGTSGNGAEELGTWLAGIGGALVEELRRTEAGTPAWTWYDDDQTAGFIACRVTCELAIHRYDAQSARGTCGPVAPEVAVDAIDEVLGPLVTGRPRTGRPAGETLHLHGTDPGADGSAEWLVTLHPDRIDVARTHAKGDLALRGPVSDLALLLYRRPALGEVQRFGDDAVLDLWYGEFVF
ncbi:MAG TPA: maleylpyruvate isomerase N-terminal domain-containing protein [Acidimicrobiales bacterium]